MPTEIERILSRLRRARSVGEGDDAMDELWKAVRQPEQRQEVLDSYHTTKRDTFALVWCLQGMTDDAVINVAKDALNHKDWNVRWAAVEVLKHAPHKSLIPVFIAALRDRADLIKGVAVEWLRWHGDSRAIEPLQTLSNSPRMLKYSPGTVEVAKAAISRLRKDAM